MRLLGTVLMYSADIQRNRGVDITDQSHKAASIRTSKSFMLPPYVKLRHLESKTWYVCSNIEHFKVTIAVLSRTHSSYSGFRRFQNFLMSRVFFLRSCIEFLWVKVATALYNSSWQFQTTSFVMQCQLHWMVKQNFSCHLQKFVSHSESTPNLQIGLKFLYYSPILNKSNCNLE